MRAKASNVTGSGKGKRFNPSNNRGNHKRKDTKQPRYTIVDVIGSVMIFVTIILSDLRNIAPAPQYPRYPRAARTMSLMEQRGIRYLLEYLIGESK